MQMSADSSLLLSVRQLACERDERLLFSGLDFDLFAGDLLQLEGPNGVGKTSLLRLLAGFLPCTAGTIHWRGQPLASCRETFHQSLLFIGHLAGIKAELTPLENLHWFAALEGIKDEALLEEALARVGLQGFEDQPSHQLSAGQKRRVALARLLLTACPLWMLDEPFTALDKAGVAAMERLLAEQAAAGGAVILTSHHALEGLAGLRKIHLTGNPQQ